MLNPEPSLAARTHPERSKDSTAHDRALVRDISHSKQALDEAVIVKLERAFTDIRPVEEETLTAFGKYGEIFARSYEGTNTQGKRHKFCIYQRVLDLQEGRIGYFTFLNEKEPFLEFQLPPMEAAAQREALDRSAKAITPRPPAAYPDTFDLPFDEVWPRDERGPGKVLVIGDPYRACDRDNATLVDYEYIEEILPPIHQWLQSEEFGSLLANERYEWMRTTMRNWLENIHRGNEFAVEKEVSGLGINAVTVPRILTEELKRLAADIVVQYAEVGVETVDAHEKLKQLKQDVANAKKGNFSPTEYLNRRYDKWDITVQERYFPDGNTNLFDWYIEYVKEHKKTIDKDWPGLLDKWKHFLDGLPEEEVKEKGFQKRVQEIRGWLEELPNVKSLERIDFILNSMEHAYYREFHPHGTNEMNYEGTVRYVSPWRSSDLESLFVDMSESYYVPGRVVNRRVSRYMDELVHFCERLLEYKESIAPVLDQEEQRIYESGVRFDPYTLNRYFHSFEQPFLQEHFHPMATQQAVAVHGFFPDRMPDVDPQDRILALYSVSTHVWDSFHAPEEFYDNIKGALTYLKKGGKYILSPVNYSQYRALHHRDEMTDERYGFPGAALHEALARLKKEGTIKDFLFRTRDENEDSTSTTAFDNGDWASSLVIEK